MTSLAKRIIHRIIQDLEGRKGIGDEWDRIDQNIQQEIKNKWVELTENIINNDKNSQS